MKREKRLTRRARNVIYRDSVGCWRRRTKAERDAEASLKGMTFAELEAMRKKS